MYYKIYLYTFYIQNLIEKIENDDKIPFDLCVHFNYNEVVCATR